MCDIGDASKGSLSSYAYILMLLHYLQQCNPPVIPVLQALHKGDKPPEKFIDGWNCWFLSDENKIVCGSTSSLYSKGGRGIVAPGGTHSALKIPRNATLFK